jgi:SNF2 family DNA or RNA helicase
VHPVLFLGLLGVIGCNFAAVGGQAQAVSLICEVDWHLVLFDEAHKLKDKKSKLVQAARQLSCPVKFGLTGTPIQNCHQEIYTLLDLLTPNCCGQWSEFDEYRLRHIGTRAGILS